MREGILAKVQERLELFSDGGDRSVLLVPEAVIEVTALLETVDDPTVDVQAVLAAGWLHWYRYLLLGPGAGEQDLSAALALFAPMYQLRPDAVPDQVRAYFDEDRLFSPDTHAKAGRAADLLEEALRTADRGVLDTAIDMVRQVLADTPAGHPRRAAMLSNLAVAMQTRFERTGNQADLDESIKIGRAAQATTPDDDPDRATTLSNLGLALRIRFERTGAPTDLDAAIITSQEAVDGSPTGHPDSGAALSNLGAALATRFKWRGELADLDAAIIAGQKAVDATPNDHPDRAGRLSNLGATLRTRFERTGAPADLDAAIAAGREAVEAILTDHPGRAAMLSNLGVALRTRFERTGVLADLDAAVDAGRAAVEATSAHDLDRTSYLSNLGIALHSRFERTGAQADLDEAITTARAAVEATPADHPDRAGRLANLGATLRTRFERTGDQADLDDAITAGRAAVDATPDDDPDRAATLANLGIALHTRFERTGDQADLDEAIIAGRDAVDVVPTDHPDRAVRLSNLGLALTFRFERTGVLADLDAAIIVGREAMDATPDDHPDRAATLANLGIALRSRFERTGDRANLDEMINIGRHAVGVETASPRVRVGAARGWGRAAVAGERWPDAVEGFAAGVEMLGQVAPRSLTRGDQEYLLAELGGLGTDAAACCIQAGLLDRAVELFEQGRGVLLSQALDTRTDLTALAERYPTLATRFKELRDTLDAPGTIMARKTAYGLAMAGADEGVVAGRNVLTDEGVMARRRTDLDRRRELAHAFDQVIAEIRALPDFTRFLLPHSIEQLLTAAVDGPVVLVNVSHVRSDAFVLTASGVVGPVPLPDMTPQAVQDHVVDFLTTIDQARTPGEGEIRATAEQRLSGVLGWLWDALAGPVLDRLGITGPPVRGEPWPRVWWCPSGLLSFLPLHAAGHHDTRNDPTPATVVDRVVCSYTPTVRALIHARRPRPYANHAATASADQGRVLAVAMRHTPGAASLVGAEAEAAELAERQPGWVDVLSGPQATHEAVLAALPGVRWAHFACHATAYPADPSASHLLLHDHQTRPLTVVDIARLRMDDAELAFLSACETARPGARLADEAIQLASAFSLAGYRHVLATLWRVPDLPAMKAVASLYDRIAAAGEDRADRAPFALHATTLALRGRYKTHPSIWAAFVHAGA